MRANLTLSTAVVACAAYPQTYIPNSTIPNPIERVDFKTIYQQNFVGFTTDGSISIKIWKLVPATWYNIFCASMNVQGLIMPSDIITGHVRTVRTACCKDVKVTILTANIYAGTTNVDAIQVTVDVLPEHSLFLKAYFQMSTKSSFK